MARPRAWDDGIGTGVKSMDVEHRLQVSLVNAIEELVRQGSDRDLVGRTAAQLAEFTQAHFQSEEMMMRLYAYPGHEAHALEHARLVEQIGGVRHRLASAEPGAPLAAIQELRSWLADHIKSMDQAFALWCARKRIAPG